MRHKGRISHPDAEKWISGRRASCQSPSQGESLLWVNSLPGSGAWPPEAVGHGGWRHKLALLHPQPAPAIQGSAKAPTWAGVRSKSKATGRSGAQLQTTPGLRDSCSVLRLEGPPSLLGRKAQKCGQTFQKFYRRSRNRQAQGSYNLTCRGSVATPTPRGCSDPGGGLLSSLPHGRWLEGGSQAAQPF